MYLFIFIILFLSLCCCRLREDRTRFNLNLEVQLMLKQGQVEVDAGSFIHDYKDSALIHRNVVEDLNTTIKVKHCITLRCLETLGRFLTIFDKGDKFCNFLFTFLYYSSLLKGSTLKVKNLLPLGADCFVLE